MNELKNQGILEEYKEKATRQSVENVLKDKIAGKREPKISLSQNETKKWCYHNTKKLLQKYRAVMLCLSTSMEELDNECFEKYGFRLSSVKEISECLDVDLSGTKIEGRLKSMERSKKMIVILNHALDSLRRYGENGEGQYWLLYYKYLCPNQDRCKNDAAIIDRLMQKGIVISTSSFYRMLSAAISALGDVLWGYTTRDILDFTSFILHD